MRELLISEVGALAEEGDDAAHRLALICWRGHRGQVTMTFGASVKSMGVYYLVSGVLLEFMGNRFPESGQGDEQRGSWASAVRVMEIRSRPGIQQAGVLMKAFPHNTIPQLPNSTSSSHNSSHKIHRYVDSIATSF